jgi:CDP-glycerol glycerophosphotransferase
LKEHYKEELLYIWIGSDRCKKGDSHTIFVPYMSLKCIFYLLTSKIIISNQGFSAWIPFRKNQVLIDTWHGGGAYKKVGIRDSEKGKRPYLQFIVKKIGKRTDFILSSCKKFTDVTSKALLIDPAKFLPYGMPRNDMFFSSSVNKDLIRNKAGIDTATSIILYAPTYREEPNHNNYKLSDAGMDFSAVVNAAETRFNKKFVLLYRTHHAMRNMDINNDSFKNVTSYPDMQDLLYIADILITDYSSSMWDFSFSFKPGFLFTPDIEEYIGERGFYTPISAWPFPYAATNEQLCKNILNFNEEENIKKIKQHHEALGSYENGNATKKVSQLIIQIFENEKNNPCIPER